jgi:hypothetical protein
LLDRGIAVAAIDARGTGELADFARLDHWPYWVYLGRPLGAQMAHDALRVVSALQRQNAIARQRVALVGLGTLDLVPIVARLFGAPAAAVVDAEADASPEWKARALFVGLPALADRTALAPAIAPTPLWQSAAEAGAAWPDWLARQLLGQP